MTAASEVVEGFKSRDLHLHRKLVEMLEENAVHRTERRGCGLTQATRFLSTFVNTPRSALDAADLGLFEYWSMSATSALAAQALGLGWEAGWRRLHAAPRALVEGLGHPALAERLRRLEGDVRDTERSMRFPESRLVVRMIGDILAGASKALPTVEGMPLKPEIGSCSQAEEFFLEIAHGRVRRHGSANLFVDEAGVPMMIEKMGLGESHSAIVIRPLQINAVQIPAGSLCALKYPELPAKGSRVAPHGKIAPLAAIREARFLRITTLAVEPEHRRRAFSAQVDAQIDRRMLSPLTTTLDDLREYAERELAAGR